MKVNQSQTNEQFLESIGDQLDYVRHSPDALFCAHFSRDADKYYAKCINMDMGDALILIRSLVKKFEIDPDLLVGSLNDDRFTVFSHQIDN